MGYAAKKAIHNIHEERNRSSMVDDSAEHGRDGFSEHAAYEPGYGGTQSLSGPEPIMYDEETGFKSDD